MLVQNEVFCIRVGWLGTEGRIWGGILGRDRAKPDCEACRGFPNPSQVGSAVVPRLLPKSFPIYHSCVLPKENRAK
jgi:hypothetical protein